MEKNLKKFIHTHTHTHTRTHNIKRNHFAVHHKHCKTTILQFKNFSLNKKEKAILILTLPRRKLRSMNWGVFKIRAKEDEMTSLTQRTRVWANSERRWRTGKPGVLQPMEPQGCTRFSGWTTIASSEAGAGIQSKHVLNHYANCLRSKRCNTHKSFLQTVNQNQKYCGKRVILDFNGLCASIRTILPLYGLC